MRKCISICTLIMLILLTGCGTSTDNNEPEYSPYYYNDGIIEVEEPQESEANEGESESTNNNETESNQATEGENSYADEGEPDHPQEPQATPKNVIAVSAASSHTLALLEDGTLWSWGAGATYENEDGTLNGLIGDGTGETRLSPTMIMENVIYAVAGPSHSLAITADGALWAWGQNQFGQLGDGTTQHRLYPVRVLEDVIYAALPQAVLNSHTGCVSWRSYAIRADGTLWAWGYNGDNGAPWGIALGDGTTQNRHTPVQIMENVIAVMPAQEGGYALTWDGVLWQWHGEIHIFGGNETEIIEARLSPEPIMNNVADIFNGFAITETGEWWTLGQEPALFMEEIKYATQTARTNFAIYDDGILWAWGQNRLPSHWRIDPILGDGTTIDRDAPVRILENVMSVTTMGSVTYAITTDGSLWGWGNSSAIIGDGSSFSWAGLYDDMGVIWGYGYEYLNDDHQVDSGRLWLIDDDGGTGLRLSPVRILENVVYVAPIYYMFDHGWINSFRAFAITECGSLWAWGENDVFDQGWGLLGDGTTQRRYYPVQVVFER